MAAFDSYDNYYDRAMKAYKKFEVILDRRYKVFCKN